MHEQACRCTTILCCVAHGRASREYQSLRRLSSRSRLDDGSLGQGRGRRPLEEAAHPSVLYLHPMGKKALRLYAVERGVKVHDLLLEAVEIWAASKGLAGPGVCRPPGHRVAKGVTIRP